MEIIHAGSDFKDINQFRMIRDFDLEIDPNGESDYKLTIPASVYKKYPIAIDDIIYIPNTEFGGPVNRRVTNPPTVEIYGKTWRGLLNKNLIIPPSGSAYKEVNGNAKTVIEDLLGDHFGTLFTVATSTVTLVDKFRYDPIGDGIHRAVMKAGAKLVITQKESSVELSVVPAVDLSERVELNEDYGVLLKIDEDQSKNVNHIVALGKGELLNRTVMQAWLLPDGTITYNSSHASRPTGRDEHTYKLDYPNAEDDETLQKAIEKTFRESKKTVKTEIDLSAAKSIEADIGDIVSSRDRLTGITVTQSIAKKIVKVHDNGRVEIRYGVKG
jgi:hypothetical protein